MTHIHSFVHQKGHVWKCNCGKTVLSSLENRTEYFIFTPYDRNIFASQRAGNDHQPSKGLGKLRSN